MKRILITLSSFALLTTAACTENFRAQVSVPHYPVHILPDAESQTYIQQLKLVLDSSLGLDPVSESINIGTRNLKWIETINKVRPVGQKLELTNAALATGSPPTDPNIYNAEIVGQKLQLLKTGIPAEMAKVLIQGEAYTSTISLTDAEFLVWARKANKIYQTAARWKLMVPYLSQYAQFKRNDVRGYYFLSREADLESKLNGLDQLPVADQDRLKEYLELICINQSGLNANCDQAVATAVQTKRAFNFYATYIDNAKQLWNSYFLLEDGRADFAWNTQKPNDLAVPFKIPGNTDVQNWLALNIQDEWKWLGWQLHLEFKPSADIHVQFSPGVTPHVNGLGGNTITMDANTALEDYETSWTIRHEFGHVAGFKDCYIEFYDQKIKAMMNYQLDLTNLMCSRKGHFLETHFNELKKYYYKAN